MVTHLQLGNMTVDVVFKDIKNIHLSVYPPAGRVRISAPRRMSEATIRGFAAAKLPWIREQQRKLREQERETNREYLARESHYVFGKRYLLRVVEENVRANVERRHQHLVLTVRPGTPDGARQAVLDEWYRNLLKENAAPIVAKWEVRLGVKAHRVFIQRMKTKWGSCNQDRGTIRLNTELAKKPPECLEYLIVHELMHLLERTHNERFIGLIDRYLPRWRFYRTLLNSLPLRHETWEY